MKRSLSAVLIVLGLFLVGNLPGLYAQEAKNVILMIGDGMGFNADLAGTYWRYGKADAQSYHKFPKHLACTTYSITAEDYKADKDQAYLPEVFWKDLLGGRKGTATTTTTDSAASASAINSGKKTKNGRIGMNFAGSKLKMYSEYAEAAGRSIGVVTTVPISHATPGAVMAHQASRNQYREIAREMILDQPITVLFGGGHPQYKEGTLIQKEEDKLDYQYVGGKAVWKELTKNQGFANALFIETKADFEKWAQCTPDKKDADLPKRLIGVARSNYSIPPVDGSADEKGNDLLHKKIKESAFDSIPTLSTMSTAALNLLARNEKGFYLMIEGGAIDGANHGNDIEREVLEHTGFSKAIDAVCAWVDQYSNWNETLLIITADHETGQLWGPNTWKDQDGKKGFSDKDQFFKHEKLVNKGKSAVPEVQYGYSSHSNALVPVWIKGAGADLISKYIRGNDPKAAQFWNFSGDYIDNTDITPFMLKASGLK
ncbi:MAG: alkaline phosphatase [Planctomycetia bacterium]|nr:alkaline phosphatase [Planctomycetia bacterium]